MRTLSVRQPWASLIVSGRKDVENRSWPTSYRGPLLIHAGLRPAGPAIHCAGLPRGAIVGVVTMIDCVCDHPSGQPGAWHWLLKNARQLEQPIPAIGQLSLYELDPVTERAVRRELANVPSRRRLSLTSPASPR
jgi:hypothetical protein